MANITIKLSDYVLKSSNNFAYHLPAGKLSDSVDALFLVAQQFQAAHPSPASYDSAVGDTRLHYSDGAYTDYAGLVFATPGAHSGNGTASSTAQYWPSVFSLGWSGQLSYNDNAAGGIPVLTSLGGTIQSARLQTLIPSSSSAYDPIFGNTILSIYGNIGLDASGDFSGTVQSLGGTANKLVGIGSATGNFNVSGNINSIVQGSSHTVVSGVLSGYTQQYTEGSAIKISNAAIQVSGDSEFDQKIFRNASNWNGDDTISVTLPSVLSQPWALASGTGNDTLTINGGGSAVSVDAGSGNDLIHLIDMGHSVDGGTGIDTLVFASTRASYAVNQTSTTGYAVGLYGGGTVTLDNVERLQFADTTVALDIRGDAGQVYRLYQAAFNRVPDAAGLGYWIHAMDNGLALRDVAASFMNSAEFIAQYGSNLSNTDFLDKLYNNVLHRSGDAAGVQYWSGVLNSGAARADVLASFGESAENQAALIATIDHGFNYTPYG